MKAKIVKDPNLLDNGLYEAELIEMKPKTMEYGTTMIMVFRTIVDENGGKREVIVKGMVTWREEMTERCKQYVWSKALAGSNQMAVGESVDSSQLIGKKCIAKVVKTVTRSGTFNRVEALFPLTKGNK
jgi:hypothetical protein